MVALRPARRALRRGVAVAMAASIALAQIVVAWHLASARHHWCAEHAGICEDVGTPPARASAAGAATAPRLAARLSDGGPSGDHEHEACGLRAAGVAGASARPGIESVATLEPTRGSSTPIVADGTPWAILRTAPKTSPPRA
jgi:hypothetical protein